MAPAVAAQAHDVQLIPLSQDVLHALHLQRSSTIMHFAGQKVGQTNNLMSPDTTATRL